MEIELSLVKEKNVSDSCPSLAWPAFFQPLKISGPQAQSVPKALAPKAAPGVFWGGISLPKFPQSGLEFTPQLWWVGRTLPEEFLEVLAEKFEKLQQIASVCARVCMSVKARTHSTYKQRDTILAPTAVPQSYFAQLKSWHLKHKVQLFPHSWAG